MPSSSSKTALSSGKFSERIILENSLKAEETEVQGPAFGKPREEKRTLRTESERQKARL